MALYECWICKQHVRRSLSGILRHIREVHRHFEGRVPCRVEGCPATPATYEGLRQHMYRYHKCLLTGSASNIATNNASGVEEEDQPQEEQDQSQALQEIARFHYRNHIKTCIKTLSFLLLYKVSFGWIFNDFKFFYRHG